jgi:hypothetical protein
MLKILKLETNELFQGNFCQLVEVSPRVTIENTKLMLFE